MSTFTELLGGAGLRDTYTVSGMRAPLFMSVARALKVLLAANGEIHPAELNAYLAVCRKYGASDDVLHELRDFDPAGVSLDECFHGVDPDSIPTRALLHNAIRIAKADGDYDGGERSAVHRAAEMLGIGDEWLANITALVDAEEALSRLRMSMLMPPGLV